MYAYEIILTLIISVIGPDGMEDVKVSFVDGSTYERCASIVACTRVYDNHIFLDANKLHVRDSCHRTPLQHELQELLYPEIEIHYNCLSNVKIVHWKIFA